jgi:hypothetical protein
MNERSPNETHAEVVSSPPANVRSTVNPIDAYQAAVAATSGTRIMGRSVFMVQRLLSA